MVLLLLSLLLLRCLLRNLRRQVRLRRRLLLLLGCLLLRRCRLGRKDGSVTGGAGGRHRLLCLLLLCLLLLCLLLLSVRRLLLRCLLLHRRLLAEVAGDLVDVDRRVRVVLLLCDDLLCDRRVDRTQSLLGHLRLWLLCLRRLLLRSPLLHLGRPLLLLLLRSLLPGL